MLYSADTPTPSLVESRASFDAQASPATTAADDIFENNVIIKQEPSESTFAANLPPTFEGMDSKQGLALFDLTQHSAAMLCDLQCRSQSSSSQISTTQWWAAFFLYLMTLQLQASSQTLIMAFWTHFPSQTARLIQASMRRLTSRSTTSSTIPLQSRSALAQARPKAATVAGDSSRWSAIALSLQRRSLMQAYLKARTQAVAARHQHRNGTVSDTMALEESGRDPDIGMGDGDSGVGR